MDAGDVNQQKKSRNKKWLWGGGIGCLVIIILFVGLGIWGFFFFKGKVDEMTTELEKMGFRKIKTAQIIEVRDSIPEKPLYFGQVVKVFSASNSDIAIIAQTAEIHGKISGNLYFRGQLLTIHPGAEITGDLDVKAQMVRNLGKVDGKITGSYQTLTTD
jgi:hypothetical protein